MREAMFNDGVTGAASRIQLPTERITRLRGLMIDLDPGKLIPDNPLFPPAEDPREFFGRIQAVLDRHPLARDAEVRSTGTGLHLLLWFEPAVELEDAAGQRRWDGLIRLTQATLPSDPNAPGITALTRPVGSINSKNGARVETLRPRFADRSAAGRRVRRAGEGRAVPRRRRDPPRQRARDALPDLLGGQDPPSRHWTTRGSATAAGR